MDIGIIPDGDQLSVLLKNASPDVTDISFYSSFMPPPEKHSLREFTAPSPIPLNTSIESIQKIQPQAIHCESTVPESKDGMSCMAASDLQAIDSSSSPVPVRLQCKSPSRQFPIKPKLKRIDSRLPVSISPNKGYLRRSKRLGRLSLYTTLEPKKSCSPKKVTHVLKPALKSRDQDTISLMVDSSSGHLHESTVLATKINATNAEGIPMLTSTDEEVTIPVKGSRKAKALQLAIVRGYLNHKPTEVEDDAVTLGFYSPQEYRRYLECDSINDPFKTQRGKEAEADYASSPSSQPKKERSVHWATELEW